MLNDLEKKVIAKVQSDMPVNEEPFLIISSQLGIPEDKLLEILKDLKKRGVIRRFGATIRHQLSGFTANAMVAWKIDENRIHEIARKMACSDYISHCYRRNPTNNWPYNLYTMIHGSKEDHCIEIAKKFAQDANIESYILLFSRKELKKTSMKYFSDFNDNEK